MNKKVLFYKYGNRLCLEINHDNVNLTDYKDILRDSIKKNDVYVKLSIHDKNLESKTRNYGKLGFYFPHLVLENKNEPILLLKLTKHNFTEDFSKILPQITMYIIKTVDNYNHQNINCDIKVRISKSTLEKINSLVFHNKDNNSKQQEFAGNIKVKSIGYKDDMIWKLGIDDDEFKLLETGETNSVEGPNMPFTFHTHPYKTYKDFQVKYAWPSQTDYTSIFLLLTSMNGLCHFVFTVEGIYCVCLNDYGCTNLHKFSDKKEKEIDKIIKNYKEDYVDIDEKSNYTPETYVKNVNKRSQILSLPFEVKYIPWHKANEPITIKVPHIKENNELTCKSFVLTDL